MKKKTVSRVLVMLLLFSLLSSFDSAAMTAAAKMPAQAPSANKTNILLPPRLFRRNHRYQFLLKRVRLLR